MQNHLDHANMTDLDQIGEAIRITLDRDSANRKDWIDIKLDLCDLFYRAKRAEKDNKKFGAWKKKHFPEVNDQDCAAYVGMGEDLDWAANVLNATKLNSMQRIFAREFKEEAPRVSKGKNKGKTREQAKAEAKATAAPQPVKPPLTMKELAIILMVCHPDSGQHATQKQRTEATAILNKHRDALVGNDDHRKAEKKAAKAKAEKKPAAQEPAAAAA